MVLGPISKWIFRLIVDGAKVVDAADITQAMACYLASFYIFNTVYPEEIAMSATFFERMLLKTPSIQKASRQKRKVISVVSSFNSVLATKESSKKKALKKPKNKQRKLRKPNALTLLCVMHQHNYV